MPSLEMTPDEAAVLAYLENRTRKRAISKARLAVMLNLDERRIQQIVKCLAEVHHKPIGSGTRPPYGYYWITSPEELRENRDSLVRRAISTLNHARVYDRDGVVGPIVGQCSILIGDETS